MTLQRWWRRTWGSRSGRARTWRSSPPTSCWCARIRGTSRRSSSWPGPRTARWCRTSGGRRATTPWRSRSRRGCWRTPGCWCLQRWARCSCPFRPWSWRWTARGFAPSLLLDDRQDVAGGVLDPRDHRPPAAEDPFAVRLELTFVALEAHAAVGEPVHGLLNIVDWEIQNGERCRSMVRLGIDEYRRAAGKVQLQQAMVFGNLQSQGSAIELLRLGDVVH